MTVFVSSYQLEPAILPKDITETTFFQTDIKTCGEVGWGWGWEEGWMGNDKAFEKKFFATAAFFSNFNNYRGLFRAHAT